MRTFSFALPTRVTFGAGAIEEAGREADDMGRHALIVTGTTFARRSGLIQRLGHSFGSAGIVTTLFDRIDPSPQTDTIDLAGSIAREKNIDFVVGLGGGSAMDAAKAIAVSAMTEHPVWEYTHHRGDAEPRAVEAALPILQIPIVASTGSETNATTVILDPGSKSKAEISSPLLQARAAIIDPTLTFTVPPHFTAVGGMNIISQMLEAYLTSDDFPVTDRITEGLIRVVMDSLPRAMRRGEDLEARSNLSWAAALASTVAMAGRSEARPLVAMAHPLTACYSLEHGMAVAALWPSYMRYALGNRYRMPQIGRFKRYALLGRQIFGVHETDDEVAADTTRYRFVNWLRALEMPTDLRGFQIDPDDFAELADQAVMISGRGNRLPGGFSAQDVERIYDGALRPD